ncbi:MAG TPA: DUF177 domain-containing protein [Dehalococcoidia bacterium]|jgi:uncharacterized protein|nr:DUF177 domain-containing protein [Dehalococcoidia bacterium]
MQVNVAQLLKELVGSSRTYQLGEVVDVTGEGDDQMVQGEVRLVRTRRGILVKGELRAQVELTCSRCLRPFDYPLAINFEEEYIPTVDIVSGLPLSRSEESGVFMIDEHHVIDLGEAIRQYTLLAMPMKPLCREDCAGLRAECGQNLEGEALDSSSWVMDPRWSELSKLLQKGNG